MIFATNIAVLTAAFDEDERGKMLGYSTCATYVGLSLGPVLGGVLNYNLGWRSIFIGTAGISALAFYFAMFKLSSEKQTNRRERKGENADAAGNVGFYQRPLFAYVRTFGNTHEELCTVDIGCRTSYSRRFCQDRIAKRKSADKRKISAVICRIHYRISQHFSITGQLLP